jgi:adenosylcobinamide-phosphate synthase
MISLQITAAIILDHVFGHAQTNWAQSLLEQLAKWLKQNFSRNSKQQGLLALALLTIPLVFTSILLHLVFGWIFDIATLYLLINMRSISLYANDIKRHLTNKDFVNAHQSLDHISNNKHQTRSEQQIIDVTIQNILIKGNEDILAVILWYIIAGAPGALLYHLINTLSRVWDSGENFTYHCVELNNFLNWLPARLSALSFVIMGNTSQAFHCLQQQSSLSSQSNNEAILAAATGSQNLTIAYKTQHLGAGQVAQAEDINRIMLLIYKTTALWVVFIFIREIILT